MDGLVHHPGPVLRWGVSGSRAGYCSVCAAGQGILRPGALLSSLRSTFLLLQDTVLPVTADSWSGDVGAEKVVGVKGDQ